MPSAFGLVADAVRTTRAGQRPATITVTSLSRGTPASFSFEVLIQ